MSYRRDTAVCRAHARLMINKLFATLPRFISDQSEQCWRPTSLQYSNVGDAGKERTRYHSSDRLSARGFDLDRPPFPLVLVYLISSTPNNGMCELRFRIRARAAYDVRLLTTVILILFYFRFFLGRTSL